MSTTSDVASHVSADAVLDTARRVLADAAAGAADRPDWSLHLDLALASAEFERVLGEPFGAEAHRARAAGLVREARSVGPWLYRGAAQIAWVLPTSSTVDGVVRRWVDEYPERGEIDLPRGLLGLGCSALDHPDAAWRDALTARVLDVIDARLTTGPDGRHLRSTGGVRYLGLAHGTAGVVAFLAAVVGAGLPGSPGALPLLIDTTRWLLAQRAPQDGTLYPRSVETADVATRSAWCHGDPGVWLALSAAAAVTGSAEVVAAAHEVGVAVVTRPPARAGVVDGDLCHGAAGLLWIAHRIGAATGHPAAQRCVAHWARYLLDARAAGPLEYLGVRGHAPDHSFLEGDAGVALALLAVATGTRPRWERLLLGGDPFR